MATSLRPAERGCHIVDARTGRAPSGLASITVTGASIARVDAHATAAYAMGAAARDWIERLEGYEAFAITEQGNSWATVMLPLRIRPRPRPGLVQYPPVPPPDPPPPYTTNSTICLLYTSPSPRDS